MEFTLRLRQAVCLSCVRCLHTVPQSANVYTSHFCSLSLSLSLSLPPSPLPLHPVCLSEASPRLPTAVLPCCNQNARTWASHLMRQRNTQKRCTYLCPLHNSKCKSTCAPTHKHTNHTCHCAKPPPPPLHTCWHSTSADTHSSTYLSTETTKDFLSALFATSPEIWSGPHQHLLSQAVLPYKRCGMGWACTLWAGCTQM